MAIETPAFQVGDWVKATSGDYDYEGVVVAVVQKWERDLSAPAIGKYRFIVQNDRGQLYIYGEKGLTL